MLDILRTIFPAATAEDGASQDLSETLTTIAAVTAGLLVVVFIAVLMGMT